MCRRPQALQGVPLDPGSVRCELEAGGENRVVQNEQLGCDGKRVLVKSFQPALPDGQSVHADADDAIPLPRMHDRAMFVEECEVKRKHWSGRFSSDCLASELSGCTRAVAVRGSRRVQP